MEIRYDEDSVLRVAAAGGDGGTYDSSNNNMGYPSSGVQTFSGKVIYTALLLLLLLLENVISPKPSLSFTTFVTVIFKYTTEWARRRTAEIIYSFYSSKNDNRRQCIRLPKDKRPLFLLMYTNCAT